MIYLLKADTYHRFPPTHGGIPSWRQTTVSYVVLVLIFLQFLILTEKWPKIFTIRSNIAIIPCVLGPHADGIETDVTLGFLVHIFTRSGMMDDSHPQTLTLVPCRD